VTRRIPTGFDDSPARTAVEVAASVGFALGIASLTGVPWLLAMTRDFSPEEAPYVYAGDAEDDEPEAEPWDPIPAQAPRVAMLARVAPEPVKSTTAPEPASAPPAPTLAELAPTVVSALPPVVGGVDVPIAAIDPLAFLDVGFGVEPDPDVEDPEDGAPEGLVDGEDNDGLADASERPFKRGGRVRARPARTKAPARPPCTEDNPAIAEVSPGHWTVQRSLVEYYAAHPLEFETVATYVITHKDAAGTPDGFKVGLKRCGVLWETGFRSGDVVHAVNTRTISTIMQAIGAYFALRNEEDFTVNVTRKGGAELELHYTLIDDTREDRHLMRDFLRAARAVHHEEKQVAREKKRDERREAR
jgi:hypothetical protein